MATPSSNLYRRGEMLRICNATLSVEPDGMTTRSLAIACLAAREFDYEDTALLRAMVGLLSNVLRKAVRRGELVKVTDDQRKAAWAIRPALPDAFRLGPLSAPSATIAA